MKNTKYFFFLGFFFLCSCVSSERENPYDRLANEQTFYPYSETSSSRGIAHLKNNSVLDERNSKFINKQMKNVIKKYRKIRQQLIIMESRVDQILKQQEFLVKQNQKTKEFIEEGLEEDADFEQSKEANADGTQESLFLEEKDSEEKKSPLWEEVTDDTILFQEEDNKEKSQVVKQKSSSVQKNKKTKKQENRSKQPAQLVKAKKLFKKKAYENAISEFQKYRDLQPKGTYYPEATFYIGESFKSLKMPVEAEVFFKEVVETHPQSLWASRAKENLQE